MRILSYVLPRGEKSFGKRYRRKRRGAKERDDSERGEYEDGYMAIGRCLHKDAEPFVRSHIFSHYRARYRVGRGDAEPRKKGGEGARQADKVQYLPITRTHTLQKIDRIPVHRMQGVGDRYRYREEAVEDDDYHLGQKVEAKPNEEERRERDDGYRL